VAVVAAPSTRTKGDVRPPDQPIAWVGADRLLLNDVTSLGMRRKVVARKDDVPDQVQQLLAVYAEAKGAQVHWWLVERGEFTYLWMIWKKEG
jgi:hypothetical protein